jgi:hypothetical protein
VNAFDNNGAVTVNPWATGISAGPADESGQTVAFQVVGNSNPSLFAVAPAVSPAGVLTFTPATVPPGTSTATITLQLKDNGGAANGGIDTSGTQSFVISITHVNSPPHLVASPKETFDTVGNTALEFKAAQSLPVSVFVNGNLVSNFTDSDGPQTLSASLVSASPGASVTINSDGTFTYVPPAGATGTDTFTYSVTDGADTVTRTVTIHLIGRLWYVKNDADSGGLGRSTDPFDTLAEAQSASAANDTIFVYGGDLTTNGQAAGITLQAGQKLYGEAYGLTINTPLNGVASTTLVTADAAKRPKIDNTAAGGNAVTVTNAGGVEVRGLSLAANTNAVNVTTSGANSGGATITDNVITGSGQQGIKIAAGGTGGTTVTIQNNAVTATGNAIDARTTAGATVLDLDGETVTSAANGIFIDGSGGGTTTIIGFANNVVSGNTVVSGIVVTSATFDATPGGTFQPIAAGSTSIGASGNGVGASGMVLTNVAGDLAFTDLDIFADGGAGLRASGTTAYTGSAGFRIGFPGIITSAANVTAVGGPAIDLQTVAMNNFLWQSINSSGSATTGAAFNSVTGTFSDSSGSSISSSTGTGFQVGSSNATISYAGTINTTTGKGVDLTSNTGSTISFTGALTLSSGSNTAFNATGGGTVTTTNTTSTLTSTTGTALNVANTTIGASGLKFKSISANGAASGIVLNTTGASGSLSVLGTGAAGSGGTIQNTSSHGISLTSTLSPSFDRMNIQNTARSGVKGTTVTNFTFTNGTINNSATGGGTDESNIAFNTAVSGTENNISGTLVITGNTLTNSTWHGVDVQNFNGTLSNVNISSNTFTSSTAVASSKGSAIRILPLGSATTAANVSAGTLSNNNISNFPSGAGIMVQGGNANASGPSGTVGTPGGGVISITSNLIQGQAAAKMGTNAIIATVTGKGQGNFDLSNNGTVANPLTNITGHVIGCGANGNTTVTCVTNGNVIVANNTAASNGVSGGTGVTFGTTDTPNMTWTINNNTISSTDGNGILAVARGATGTLKVKIQNNNVGAPLTGVRPGIRIDAGNAGSVNDSVCLNISGNTTAGSGGTNGIGLRKQGTVTATNAFGINGMAATASPGVESYVDGLNPADNGTLLISATSGFSNCSLP